MATQDATLLRRDPDDDGSLHRMNSRKDARSNAARKPSLGCEDAKSQPPSVSASGPEASYGRRAVSLPLAQHEATVNSPPRIAASVADCLSQASPSLPSPLQPASSAPFSHWSVAPNRSLRHRPGYIDLRLVAAVGRAAAPWRYVSSQHRSRSRSPRRCIDTMDADISGDDNRSPPSGLHQPGYEQSRRHNLRPPLFSQFSGEAPSSSFLPSRDGGARAAPAASIATAESSPDVDVDAERYYRSFPGISGQNTYSSLNTNALASMPAITDTSRLPSSLRSNSNGTTPRHPPIAPSRNLKPPYRSVSAPVDEGAAGGSTRAISSSSGTQKLHVRDLARRFEPGSAQAVPASTHSKPSARSLKDGGSHGTGFTKRATGETPATSAQAKPSMNVQDTELTRTKSNAKSQRTRFAAEDQRSNNALSSVPRPSRSSAKDIAANIRAAQSSTNLSRPPPLKLPTKIPDRKPLFGELPPNATGSSNLGYGIPSRRLSDPSSQSPVSIQHRGEVIPKSPTLTSAATGELLRDMEASRVPRLKKHDRSRNDPGEDKSSSGVGGNSSSARSPTQSRLPISAKRRSTPSESSSPSSTRSTSPLSTKARAPAPSKSGKGDTGPRSPITQSPRDTNKSPGRHARGLANISTASLSAVISVSPPKSSPTLRGSRQRLPVSTASAPRLKSKATEQTVDYEARRRQIERSYSRAIRRNEENQRLKLKQDDQPNTPACDQGDDLAVQSLDDDSPTSAATEAGHEELPIAAHVTLPHLSFTTAGTQAALDSADMDSPTLGMPGIFPTFNEDDNRPQSSTPVTAGVVESEKEERESLSRHNGSPQHPRPPMIVTCTDIQPQYDDSPLEINSGTGSIKIILDAHTIGEPLEAPSAQSGDVELSFDNTSKSSPGTEGAPTIKELHHVSGESNELSKCPDDLNNSTNITGENQYFEEPQPISDSETRDTEQPNDVVPQDTMPETGPSASGSLSDQESSASPVTEMDFGDEEAGGVEGLHGLPGHYDTPHSARLSIPYPRRLPTNGILNSENEWIEDTAITTTTSIEPAFLNTDQSSSFVDKPSSYFVDKPTPPPKEEIESLKPDVPPKPPHYSPLPSPGLIGGVSRISSPKPSVHNDHSSSVDSFGAASSLKSPSKVNTMSQIPSSFTSSSSLPPQARGEASFLQPGQLRRASLWDQTETQSSSPRGSVARAEAGEGSVRSDVEHVRSNQEEPPKPVALTEEETARLTKRGHVIKELIDTESIYLKDMNVVEEIYRGTAEACPNLEATDVKIIFRNSGQIVGFSTMFLDELKAAAAFVYTPRAPRPRSSAVSPGAVDTTAPFNSPYPGSRYERDQKTYIGALFLRHLKEMKEVYTEFLRRHEQAMTRLGVLQPTPTVKVWLDECNLVAKDLTSAWDLDALLIKPVQRITRYQLFLLELKGKTPESHPDYLSIETARERLVDLLQGIDTLKKRLDTVTKIVNGTPKVNVRSGLVANFIRRRDRSLATIRSRPNDDVDFVKAHDKFSNDFICMQIVLRDVEFYTRHMKEYVEKFLSNLSAIELFMRASTNHQCPEIESKWTRFNVSMRSLGTYALDDHTSTVRRLVIEPFEAVIKAYAAPHTAIVKRGKRRADYEKYLSLKAANKKIDEKMMEQVREYEALNETLKFELPKLAAMTERLGKACMERFIVIQHDWWAALQAKVRVVLDSNQISRDLDSIVEHFRREFRHGEARISELGITNQEFLQSIGTGRLSQSTTATREDDASIHSRSRNGTFNVTSRSRGISLTSDHTPSLSTQEPQNRFSDGHFQSSETANRHATTEYLPIRDGWLISPTTAQIEATLKHFSSEPAQDVESSWRRNPINNTINTNDNITIPTRKSSVAQSPADIPVPDTYIQKVRSRYPIEVYENPESLNPFPVDPDSDNHKVLYLAASLFEFNFSGDKRVGDFRYLTYQAGEVFDVIGENGELWLARNQDDPNQEIGWIWSKHFARLVI